MYHIVTKSASKEHTGIVFCFLEVKMTECKTAELYIDKEATSRTRSR